MQPTGINPQATPYTLSGGSWPGGLKTYAYGKNLSADVIAGRSDLFFPLHTSWSVRFLKLYYG